MSEFSDRPFVAGSITGIRSFGVDKLGRLVGPAQGTVFSPGENLAGCHAKKNQHPTGTKGCSCGFYAYFDTGNNPQHRPGNLQALIEGYGTVTVGSRGFRCEKARLLALVKPGMPFRLDRIRLHTWVLLASAGGLLAAFLLDAPLLVYVLTAIAILLVVVWRFADYEPFLHPNYSKRYAAVYRNYPETPVYRSVRAALAKHPLTKPPAPELPTPESDPNFWTKAVPS